MNLLEVIEIVFAKVAINRNLQIYVNGEPIFCEYLFLTDMNFKIFEAKKRLGLIIYEYAYINSQKSNIESNITDLQISLYNKNKKSWTKNCKTIFVENNYSLIVEKNNFRKRVMPGEYIKKNDFYDKIKETDIVDVFFPSDNLSDKKPYLIIYGNQFYDNLNSEIFRIYFNICKAGMGVITELITEFLKDSKSPYELKFQTLDSSMQRTDNGVLYFGKKICNQVFDFINNNYDKFKKFLLPEVPLGAKKIFPGIGFAENPNFTNESFGMSRSILIADALVQYVSTSNISMNESEFILLYFKEKGFDINNVHLNPKLF